MRGYDLAWVLQRPSEPNLPEVKRELSRTNPTKRIIEAEEKGELLFPLLRESTDGIDFKACLLQFRNGESHHLIQKSSQLLSHIAFT